MFGGGEDSSDEPLVATFDFSFLRRSPSHFLGNAKLRMTTDVLKVFTDISQNDYYRNFRNGNGKALIRW